MSMIRIQWLIAIHFLLGMSFVSFDSVINNLLRIYFRFRANFSIQYTSDVWDLRPESESELSLISSFTKNFQYLWNICDFKTPKHRWLRLTVTNHLSLDRLLNSEKPAIKILLLGLDNAGKTSTALHLSGGIGATLSRFYRFHGLKNGFIAVLCENAINLYAI